MSHMQCPVTFISLLLVSILSVCVSNAQTVGQDTVRILTPNGRAKKLSYSPDGRYLVVGGSNLYIKIWDLVTGQSLDTYEIPVGKTYNVEFFPDGEHIMLSVSYGATLDSVHKWNWRDRRSVWTVPAVYGSLSHGGDTVAVANYDGTLSLVRGKTGETFRKIGKYFRQPTGFRMNKRGDRLLYYSGDIGSALIDLETGQALSGYRVQGEVLSGRFSPDDKVIAVGASRPIVLDARTADSLFVFENEIWRAFDIAYSPDGEYLVTAGFDSSIRLWDALTGDSLAVLGSHSTFAYSVEFSPDGKYVASASLDFTVRIWPIPKRPSSVRRLTSVRNTMSVNAFPDPSLDRTTVEYTLERTASAQLRLVNAMGIDVLSLNEPQREPGIHRVALDVSALPSGMYFVVVTADAEQSVRPLRVAR